MSYQENLDFDKAIRDAGLHGVNRDNLSAKRAFSNFYHENWPKWERERDGYFGILEKAKDWWREYFFAFKDPGYWND